VNRASRSLIKNRTRPRASSTASSRSMSRLPPPTGPHRPRAAAANRSVTRRSAQKRRGALAIRPSIGRSTRMRRHDQAPRGRERHAAALPNTTPKRCTAGSDVVRPRLRASLARISPQVRRVARGGVEPPTFRFSAQRNAALRSQEMLSRAFFTVPAVGRDRLCCVILGQVRRRTPVAGAVIAAGWFSRARGPAVLPRPRRRRGVR
jgi:hypothetical protein